MEKTEQSLKKLTKTLERYQKNKTLVSPDLLEGVYRIPFFKLKLQLAKETTDYVRNYCYEGLKVFPVGKPGIEAASSGGDRKVRYRGRT